MSWCARIRRRCRPALVLTALVMACSGLAGCKQPGFGMVPTTSIPTVRAAMTSTPLSYVGVYEPGTPKSYAPITGFGNVMGRQPNLALYFSGWKQQFDTTFARLAYKHGATAFVSMNPGTVTMSSIASGLYDSYLRSYARSVRTFRHTVLITFAHEMNGGWYAYGYHHEPPADYIAAWRHIVTVFRQTGADNVTWIWAVNREGPGEGPIQDWWPGAAYVDWVGIDGYYELPTSDFQTIFGQTVSDLRKFTTKPVLLSEAGVGQVAGQAAKIPGLFAGIRAEHLLGMVWFDAAQREGIHHQDWRLEGHAAAIVAFRHGLVGF